MQFALCIHPDLTLLESSSPHNHCQLSPAVHGAHSWERRQTSQAEARRGEAELLSEKFASKDNRVPQIGNNFCFQLVSVNRGREDHLQVHGQILQKDFMHHPHWGDPNNNNNNNNMIFI